MSEVGVPLKGRNAGIALEEELDDAREIVDLLNGMGKRAAKTGEDIDEVTDRVSRKDSLEMRDTGRPYPRPVLTDVSVADTRLVGGRNDFGEADIVYRGIDDIAEQYLDNNQLSDNQSLPEYAEEIAADREYELDALYSSDEEDRWVTWGLMNNDLDKSPSKVLYPCKFENLSEAALDRIDVDVEMETFSEYAESNGYAELDEEEVVYKSPEEIARLYMWVSGDTADEVGDSDDGLEKEQVSGFRSKLGRFQRCRRGV